MRKSLGTVSLVLFLGLIIGSILGEVIGLFLDSSSVAYALFAKKTTLINLEPMHLNLVVMNFTFGFRLQLNLMSVVGVFMASQMLRWYR